MAGFDLSKAAGLGTEDIDPSVLGMPLLSIMQKGSPEVDVTHKDHATKTIDGIKVGDAILTSQRAVLPNPFQVIPLRQQVCYAEWEPKKPGSKGLVCHRDLTAPDLSGYRKGDPGSDKKWKEYLGDNELIKTYYFHVMLLLNEEWVPAVFAMSGGSLAPARGWQRDLLNRKYPNNAMRPPIFSSVWDVSVIQGTSQVSGDGFFKWEIGNPVFLDLKKDQDLLEMAFNGCKGVTPMRLEGGKITPALKSGDDADLV
tara:strand:+ start:1503 stop:2267 length:765 start_codon:yes stop_codon:yes gene_type:complete